VTLTTAVATPALLATSKLQDYVHELCVYVCCTSTLQQCIPRFIHRVNLQATVVTEARLYIWYNYWW